MLDDDRQERQAEPTRGGEALDDVQVPNLCDRDEIPREHEVAYAAMYPSIETDVGNGSADRRE